MAVFSCMAVFMQYFGQPTGQAKMQRTSKNIQQYYTLKCLISYLLSNCLDTDTDFVNTSEQKENWLDVRRDTWCVMSVVEYFDWLKKQPVNQVPSTEPTIIYSKIVVWLP